MASYRVGIIGPGHKGVEYAVAYRFHPQTEVVAAADPDAETLGMFCDRFGVPGYADYREMLARERIDVAAAILPVGSQPRRRGGLRAGRRPGGTVRETDGGQP